MSPARGVVSHVFLPFNSPLFFLPFKGRTEEGMVFPHVTVAINHPHPNPPLEGEGVTHGTAR
jgi:hypothetical protein